MSLAAEFRGWYPYWQSQMRSWNMDEATIWAAFIIILFIYLLFNVRRRGA